MLEWRINSPSVVSELIDDEAVIMNLESGHYFSTRGTGAAIWDAIDRGWPVDAITAWAATRYGITVTDASAAIERFLAQLTEHALVRVTEVPDAPVSDSRPSFHQGPASWSAPSVEAYTDMEDLLLLDPIHDVGETGWPVPPSHLVD